MVRQTHFKPDRAVQVAHEIRSYPGHYILMGVHNNSAGSQRWICDGGADMEIVVRNINQVLIMDI